MLAATNRIDTLDSALLRPGRLDRQIEIGMPEVFAREKILDVLLSKRPVDADVSLEEIAVMTTDFSGAALESMVNEAAIYAVRENNRTISWENIQRAYISVIAGEDKKCHAPNEIDKQICAVHEAGHAIAAMRLTPEEKIKRVSIIPNTRGAGGYVLRNVSERMTTKGMLVKYIIIAYAGRAAEEIFLGKENVSRGAAGDIEKATEMITTLTARYGMDAECGPLCYERNDSVVTAAKRRIAAQLYAQALELVKENADAIEKVRDMLLERESISGSDIDGL